MTHPFIRTGRSLVGMVLVLLGLSTFGCGDTGTQSQPAELGSLSVSPGSLKPPFNPATTSYTATVSSNVSSTTITASPRVTGDTIQIDNQRTSSQSIILDSPGAEKSVNIVVTETGTGGTSKSYTVRVRRELEDTTLATLSVSTGTLAPSTFDKDTPDYTVNDISNAVTNITISATKSNLDTVMQIDAVTVPAGVASGQANVQLGGPGSTTKVSIVVTAQGGSSNTYTVTINRGASDNNFLSNLSLLSGSTTLSLSPRFNQAAPDYTVNVASTVGSVSVTARLDDTTARLTVNGRASTSGQAQTITLNPAGQNPSPTIIPIVVTAQNGSQRTYSVNIIRAALGGNNRLSALRVTADGVAESLDPSFNADTTSYRVDVESGVTSISVTPTLQDTTATMTVNGQPTPSEQARAVTLNGAGSDTLVNIVVTAPNGTQKTYALTARRAALGGNNNLSALTVTPTDSLNPVFTASTTRYTANVGSTVASVTVRATKADPNAVMSDDVTAGAGAATGQATIQLGAPGTTTVVTILVTAPNGSQKPYRIDVVRALPSSNNDLSALSVRVGSVAQILSPTFAPSTTAYTVDVAPEVTEVIVSAEKDDRNATMAIGSVTVSAGTATGQATFPLNGAGGQPTTISIAVTAQDGNAPKIYTLSVIRPAAPTPPSTPTVAPDLIAEDDSCPLVLNSNLCFSGSNTDNITNVKRPRFRIPKPATGETPSLYIGPNKDASASFDAGTNTLRPSADLSDGNHTITYTLTNSVGESAPSPALTVTIDTGAPLQ